MVIDIRQKYKELFEAAFIIESDKVRVGEMKLIGKLGNMEGTWYINYSGLSIQMSYIKQNLLSTDKPFRPYNIFINGKSIGMVYQTDVKEGGLFSKYSVHKVYIYGENYTLYPISFGYTGAKSPLFYQGVQVAEIHKSNIIYNELHEYRIYSEEKQYDLVCLILCCYSYVMAFFKPGEKPTVSVRKINSVSRNKYLLAKYDFDYISKFRK